MTKAFKKLIILLILVFMSINLSGCNIIELLDIAFDIIEDFNGTNNDEEYVYPDIDVENVKTLSDLYKGIMPSIGEAKALVILIEFPDHTHEARYTPQFMHEVFFGQGLMYESVASYYKKSSNSKLNITGEVIGWYKTEEKSSTYERKYGDYTSDMVVKEAIEYYYSNNLIDLSKFDGNNDGYIDAVYAVYSKPENEFSDVWWAYQTYFEDYNTGVEDLQLGNMKLRNYVWASSKFLNSSSIFSSTIDTTTFIHETGHLFGLDDYYDYNEYDGANVGLGSADMMDYNVGDHCSLSKMLLGWVEPIVVSTEETKDYTIKSFTNSGEVLLIPLSEYNGIFGEYLLIEFYTPTGLNKSNTYLTKSGVRILYVNATLGEGGMSGNYYTLFNHDNSDTDIPLICMLTKSGMVSSTQDAANHNLFQVNDSYDAKYIYYANSEYKNFSLSIVSQNTQESTITINVKFN